MPPVLSALLAFVAALWQSRQTMHLRMLALSHQVAVYKQTVTRRRLRPADRLFWTWLSRLWPGWHAALACVQPRTVIAPKSPWQNPYVERLLGSMRRECLDHVLVLHERHLRRILTHSFAYDHRFRTYLAFAMDCPEPRPIQARDRGRVLAVPEVSGLHHHYERVAANDACSERIDLLRL